MHVKREDQFWVLGGKAVRRVWGVIVINSRPTSRIRLSLQVNSVTDQKKTLAAPLGVGFGHSIAAQSGCDDGSRGRRIDFKVRGIRRQMNTAMPRFVGSNWERSAEISSFRARIIPREMV